MYIDIITEYIYAYSYNVTNNLLTSTSLRAEFMGDFYNSYLSGGGLAPNYSDFTSIVQQYQLQYSSSYLNLH